MGWDGTFVNNQIRGDVGKSKEVDPAHLSKIWKIDLKTAERTLEVVSQSYKRTDNPTLSRNYGTTDRML